MGNAYNNASLLVTPEGYEAGTIFSAKPTDGSGDLAFSRASTAMRRNSAGLWEEVANNVPRLQYPVGGGCPSWLFEPQATNLVPNSNTFIGDTTKTTGITDSPISGVTSVRCTKTSASVEYIVTSYSATITNSTPYCPTIYFKYDGHNIDSSLEFNNGGDFGISWRADIEIRSTGITINSTTLCSAVLVAEANGWYRLEVSLTSATVTANSGSILIKAAGASGASFLITTSNLTQSSVATSPIITAGSAVTRLADTCQKANFGNTSTAGTLYYEFLNYNSPAAANGEYMVALFVGSTIGDAFYNTANSISIINNGTQVQGFNNAYLTNLFSIAPAAGATVKVALRYDGTNVVAFVNGVKGTVFADTSVGVKNAIRVNNGENATHSAKELLFIPAAISDSEAIELTTL
jgi:hypothetical protein